MKILWHDPLEWIYPDRMNRLKRMNDPHFEVPRGGICSLGLVLSGLTPGRPVSLETDDPRGRFFLMKDVLVNLNTAETGFAEREGVPKSQSVTRDAPFRVYDVLRPVADGSFVPESGCAVLYFQRDAGQNEKPGLRTIRVEAGSGEERTEGHFSMRVSPVRLPRTGKGSVIVTNWINPLNIGFPEETGLWTPRFWKQAAVHAALMHHMRQNMIFIPLRLFFSYDAVSGTFALREKELKRWIRTFTDAGLYWLEGGHFGVRDGSWTAVDFKVIHSGHSVRTLEGCRDIARMAGLLRKFIDRNGLRERWIQHVADEPINCNADSYRIFAGTVRRYLPGIPLADAASEFGVSGALDIWCPQIHLYQKNREGFEEARALGDRLWCYTCCHPGGLWLNRLCDGELARPRLLGWGCGAYNMEGFLHWGWNQYVRYTRPDIPPRQDPYEDTAPLHNDEAVNHLPPGDTHIVYPGPEGAVFPSLRLEAQREGIEDWELIRMLRKKDPGTCDSIIRSVFRDFRDYTPDPEKIRAARSALIHALESEQ